MNCTPLDRLDISTASDDCMIDVESWTYLQMVVSVFGLLRLGNDLVRRTVQQVDNNNTTRWLISFIASHCSSPPSE